MARRRNRRSNYKPRRTRRYYPPKRSLRSPLLKSIRATPVSLRTAYTPTYIKKRKPRNILTHTIQVNNQPSVRKNVRPLPYSGYSKKMKKALICARRQQRKEILHAKRQTGKAGQRNPRRNQYSHIKC